jgi:hypothetical protein
MRQLYQTSICSFILILTASWVAGEEKSTSFVDLKDKVDRRVADWQPTAEEKRFDQIGWCTSSWLASISGPFFSSRTMAA